MDIYAVNDKLIETLTKGNLIVAISKIFNSHPSNTHKVTFIEQLLVKYDLIPKTNPRQAKDNTKSNEFRQNGNVLFGSGKVFEALDLYNQSICWAESNDQSEELAICYANRSAVYYKLKMYEMCCDNIDLAKKSGYPKRLMEKLMKREMDCLDHINNVNVKSSKIEYTPKLDIPSNPRIPFIGDCLEMKDSKDQGRYIITNSELNPGQVIAIEEPYAVTLQAINRYHRCANCLTENSLSLIPCPACTNAMFCSQKCLTQANEEFHRFECLISDYLLLFFNKIHLSALRVTLKAIGSFESIEEMVEFCRENENANVTTFSFTHTSALSARERYQQIHCLATNQDKRTPSDLFQRATIAAVLYNQLMKNTKLVDILTTDSSRATFIEILFRHLQTSPTNYHTLSLAETPDMEGIDYANGTYPFCSLLNHSCAPNICRMPIGRKMMVFALRVVKQGESLYDNYG